MIDPDRLVYLIGRNRFNITVSHEDIAAAILAEAAADPKEAPPVCESCWCGKVTVRCGAKKESGEHDKIDPPGSRCTETLFRSP